MDGSAEIERGWIHEADSIAGWTRRVEDPKAPLASVQPALAKAPLSW